LHGLFCIDPSMHPASLYFPETQTGGVKTMIKLGSC